MVIRSIESCSVGLFDDVCTSYYKLLLLSAYCCC